MKQKKKKNVLVTVADQNHILKAKQVFACAHFNAGWPGDLLLFSHKIPERDLKWFRRKGILVKKCRPIYKKPRWRTGVHTSKLYLFSKGMSKWDRIIYVDTDTIIRASLDWLTKIKGFAVTAELDHQPLYDQFLINSEKSFLQLKKTREVTKKNYNLVRTAFNTGVVAFSTNEIKKGTFQKLKKTLALLKDISSYGADSVVLNLYYYRKWTKLPRVFNLHPLLYMHDYKIKPNRIIAIVLHFAGDDPKGKPWYKENPFYREWKENLNKAEFIDRKNIPQPVEIWSGEKIWIYEKYLALKRSFYNPIDKHKRIIKTLKYLKLMARLKYPKLYAYLKRGLL